LFPERVYRSTTSVSVPSVVTKTPDVDAGAVVGAEVDVDVAGVVAHAETVRANSARAIGVILILLSTLKVELSMQICSAYASVATSGVSATCLRCRPTSG
jgi:hypothetical protein